MNKDYHLNLTQRDLHRGLKKHFLPVCAANRRDASEA